MALVDPPIAAFVTTAFSKASRQNPRRPDLVSDHGNDPLSRSLGDSETARIDGRHSGTSGQAHAEGLDHAGHRRGRPHRHAVPMRATHTALSQGEVLLAETPGPELLREVPHRSARTEIAPLVSTVQHRAARDDNRRQVDAGSGHEHRRGRFVTSAEEHDAVEGVGAQRLFDLHRHQVPEEHRGRSDQRLAK